MLLKYLTLTILLYGCVQYNSAVDIYELELSDLLKMQQGLGWPHTLNVIEGHEALMKLTRTLENQQTCTVTSPSGTSFNINTPPNNRFESWGEDCGVRMRNVMKNDQGRWRLTSTRWNDTLTGFVEVFVQEDPAYVTPPILLQDGQTHTNLELTTLNNFYCVVTQPFSESTLVSGHCNVALEKTTRAVQGNWSILVGIPGRVSELSIQRQVFVETEHLDVGYMHDTSGNKLNLYCNIQHTNKNITFCRFQKTTSSFGYNVKDGLSDGIHSYYGEGFAKRHCGMTIENPPADVYGTWRCSLGVQQWVENTIVQQTPLQALISVAPNTRNLKRSDDDIRTIFVQKGQSFTILCNAEVSLSYCWFQHPNGTQFSSVPLTDEEQQYWYTGESLETGDCGITFYNVTQEDQGEWTCHMGPSRELGVEVTDRVYVRVTGPLAANRNEVIAQLGEPAILYCHTSNGIRPLDYCRFLSPTFLGLHISSSVTQENPIMGRFYFTPGRNIDHGDCSLSISVVEEEDMGVWTCAALVDGELLESRDTISILVSERRSTFSRTAIIGLAVGGGIAIMLVAGALGLVYKRQQKVRSPEPSVRVSAVGVGEAAGEAAVSFNLSERRASASSGGSNEHEPQP